MKRLGGLRVQIIRLVNTVKSRSGRLSGFNASCRKGGRTSNRKMSRRDKHVAAAA